MDLEKEHFCQKFEKSNNRYHTFGFMNINKTGNVSVA